MQGKHARIHTHVHVNLTPVSLILKRSEDSLLQLVYITELLRFLHRVNIPNRTRRFEIDVFVPDGKVKG
jgi:hypothetical protein